MVTLASISRLNTCCDVNSSRAVNEFVESDKAGFRLTDRWELRNSHVTVKGSDLESPDAGVGGRARFSSARSQMLHDSHTAPLGGGMDRLEAVAVD